MRNSEQYQIKEIRQDNKFNGDVSITSEQLAQKIAEAADDKKAADIILLKVSDVSYLADYFVIATGFSKTQIRAISDEIEEKIVEQFQRAPIRVEGKTEGNWILQDYGDVIVHIFLPEDREYYNLEAFWGHAERIQFQESS
ncbi:MAG: ribosome silencing factor [Xenococcaceae cyanobacterium MO_188.B32]|nr:ribosome silencing factor [Xenococcaceae cyanobacterium MO_188.B32]